MPAVSGPLRLCRGYCLALLALLCAGPAAADTDIPTPATDPQMARNLGAMATQPGVLDIQWREATETVTGSKRSVSFAEGDFPAQEALEEARAYSDAHGGLGFMVWHDGRLVDAVFADGVTSETPFSAFSMHKSVLGMAVLAAVEDGILPGLDAPVGPLIPQWSDDPRGQITIRQLLTQVSGLAHFSFQEPASPAAALALSSQISDTALSYPLSHEPGTHFNYNNVNAQVAGIALENALARRDLRYADYLSQRLWQPLGNNDASLWLEAEGGSPRYYAGLSAGLADWLRIGVMLAEHGKAQGEPVLSEESVSTLTHPTSLNPGYGLGVWLAGDWAPQRRYGPTTPATVPHAEPYLAADVAYFDGFGGQRVYVVPSARLAIARFGPVDMGYDDSVIVNTLLRGLQQAVAEQRLAEYRSESAQATYLQRFEQLRREAQNGRGLAGYDPLVPMPGAEEVQPLARGSADWLTPELDEWLRELGAGTNTQALMLWQGGEVVFEDYFGGNDAQDLVVSRSLSKPLSVIAVGRAIEEGFIPSLDEPASRYLTEWQDTDKAGITIRHLLQMRSGLAQQGGSMEPDDVMNRAYLHPYHIEVILAEYPLVNEPGTRYDYSNANGELIAPIIERATGRRYEEWISAQVLAPLGAAGGDIWINRIGGTPHSGCCARLPAESYLRLALLIHQDGVWDGERLLPEGYVAEARTPTPYNPHTGMGIYVAGPYVEGRGAANPDFPYGKTKHSVAYLDKDLYLFDGNGNQVVYVIERHDLVILRIGARPPKDRAWDNPILPNRVLQVYSEETGAELLPQPGPKG